MATEELSYSGMLFLNMFDQDHSAARGYMATRKLVIFKHDSLLGNVPAHKLFDMVKASPKNNPPRDFNDYEVKVPNQDKIPSGVTIMEKL